MRSERSDRSPLEFLNQSEVEVWELFHTVAMAFSMEVAVVLIDEPFNALDAAARVAVHEWLVTRAAEQRQIIAITSHLEPQAFNQLIDLA